MDNREIVERLNVERCCVEQDLAMGNRRRARRRVSRALDGLLRTMAAGQPDLAHWMRILAALATVDRPPSRAAQLSLWPEPQAAQGGLESAQTREQLVERNGRDMLGPAAVAGLGVVTQDERLLQAMRFLVRVAPTDLPVLIEGESGTGKEVVARAIHAASRRGRSPWIAVNCGALPPQLQESELFGHARGAFTGATSEKPGLFEAADGGTLFLDEVGEMDARAQVKLLRVLESGELRRLGEIRTRRVDVRILAATNADIDEAVRGGGFRKDLLYRLGAVRSWLPPLRMRRGDILPLTNYFVCRCSHRTPALTPAAREALLSHDWPGNVRELKFAVQRALALWSGGAEGAITVGMLFPEEACAARWSRAAASSPASPLDGAGRSWEPDLPLPAGSGLTGLLEQIERRLILKALHESSGSRAGAARLLGGMSRTTLIGRMKRLGLWPPAPLGL